MLIREKSIIGCCYQSLPLIKPTKYPHAMTAVPSASPAILYPPQPDPYLTQSTQNQQPISKAAMLKRVKLRIASPLEHTIVSLCKSSPPADL